MSLGDSEIFHDSTFINNAHGLLNGGHGGDSVNFTKFSFSDIFVVFKYIQTCFYILKDGFDFVVNMGFYLWVGFIVVMVTVLLVFLRKKYALSRLIDIKEKAKSMKKYH
jgi:hypothetical protein